MEEVAKGLAQGTLTAYQVPSSSYLSAEQIASGVSNGSSMNQIAASSVLSRIAHERTHCMQSQQTGKMMSCWHIRFLTWHF